MRMIGRAALLSSLMLLLLLLGSSCQARPVRHSGETEEPEEREEEFLLPEEEEDEERLLPEEEEDEERLLPEEEGEEELLLPEEEREGREENEYDDEGGSSRHSRLFRTRGGSEDFLERLINGRDEMPLPREYRRDHTRTSRTSRMRVGGDKSSLPPRYRRTHKIDRSHRIVGNTESSLPPEHRKGNRENMKRQKIDSGVDQPLPYRHGYIGCYKDTRSSPDLPKLAYSSPKNSVAKCRRECQRLGYHYAGLQAGNECRCGKHFGKHGQASNCNAKCTGNSRQTCGGKLANSIYHSRGFRDVGIHSRIGGKGPLPSWFSIGKPSTPPGSTNSSLPHQFRKKNRKIGKPDRNIRGGTKSSLPPGYRGEKNKKIIKHRVLKVGGTDSSLPPKYRKKNRKIIKRHGFKLGGTDSSLAPKYRKKNRKIIKHRVLKVGGTDSSLPPKYRKKNRKIIKRHGFKLGGTDSSLAPKYRKKHTTVRKSLIRHVRVGGDESSLPPRFRKHRKVGITKKTTRHRIVKTHGKGSKGPGGKGSKGPGGKGSKGPGGKGSKGPGGKGSKGPGGKSGGRHKH